MRCRPKRLLHGLICAVAVPVGTAAQQAGHPGAGFHSSVDLVTLNVTVTDDRQQFVRNLDAGQFQVLENGLPQSLTFFQNAPTALTLSLVLDVSASMKTALPALTEAAAAFVRDLREGDRASVVAFNRRIRVLQGFTNDRAVLEAAIHQATASSSTSLFTALYVALKELERADVDADVTVPRRRVLILLSDGDDTASLVPFEAVLDTASRADTVIYAIRLEGAPLAGPPNESRFVLRRIVEQTGGRAFFAATAYDLPAVYKAIRAELANQYVLAYVPRDRHGSAAFRQLAVLVNSPRAVARTRRGYFPSGR